MRIRYKHVPIDVLKSSELHYMAQWKKLLSELTDVGEHLNDIRELIKEKDHEQGGINV